MDEDLPEKLTSEDLSDGFSDAIDDLDLDD